jgi:hypothetical protein
MVCPGMLTPDPSAVTYMEAGMFVAKVAQAGDRIHSKRSLISIFPTCTLLITWRCFSNESFGPCFNLLRVILKFSLLCCDCCDKNQSQSGQDTYTTLSRDEVDISNASPHPIGILSLMCLRLQRRMSSSRRGP